MFARVGLRGPEKARDPVVLVHGQVISSLYMVPTARRLARDYAVLAPDLPGFGLSGKPKRVLSVPGLADALGDWMQALQLPPATLVGNSLGCQVIVDLAVRRPELARALVLAGPTMDTRGRTASVQIARWLRDWQYERPSLALAHLRDFARAGARRAVRTFQFALADRIEAKLPQVRVETLVVRGELDPIVPQRWAEEVTRLLPRARLAVIPQGSHCVNYSMPTQFSRVVSAFLVDLGVGRGGTGITALPGE